MEKEVQYGQNEADKPEGSNITDRGDNEADNKADNEANNKADNKIVNNINADNDINADKNINYSGSSIIVLEGLAAVRKRPAMYIGNTNISGLHHLIYEIVDNSIDEAMAGFCSKIEVTLHKDNSITVLDNGRGIPVDIMPKYNKSALEVVMTFLHAGGKFGHNTYKVSGGLHGVGASVVNGLSEFFEVEVYRNGKIYYQKYEKGIPVCEVKITGEANNIGTKIHFMPDTEIFKEINFNLTTIISRLRELSFLNKGLRIIVADERIENDNIKEFCYEGGIKEFVTYLNENKKVLHNVIHIEKFKDDVVVEIALQYNGGYSENILSFANNIHTIDGGFHVVGFKAALNKVVNKYVKENKVLKEDEKLEGEDIREGLTGVISVKMRNPEFEGQTKTRLGNNNIRGIVDGIVSEYLMDYFEKHPNDAKNILTKAANAMKARNAARKAKELVRRKGIFDKASLPGKLADCANNDAEKCEIYIVEGDSAGGCFSGDTKVALLDGRNLSFKELVKEDIEGKRNYCYTIKKDKGLGVGLIENPRMTKKNTKVIKIILDNDGEIICTPEHLFMLRDNSYCMAKNLTNTDSIMPLVRKLSVIEGKITIERYEMVYGPRSNKWLFTHILADNYNLENRINKESDGAHKHPIDFNKLNNNPENIQRLSKEEHIKLHAEIPEKTTCGEDVVQKCKEIHQGHDFRKNMSEVMSSRDMKKMPSEHRMYLQKEENRKLQSEKTMKFFAENPDVRKKLSNAAKEQLSGIDLKRNVSYYKTYFKHTIGFMKQLMDNYGNLDNYDIKMVKSKNKHLLEYETFSKRFFGGDKNAMTEAVKNYNHKIKKIVEIDQKIDVYDLEVKGTHNFALSSGIFVHNSAKLARNKEFQAILPLKGKILNVEKARLDKILENNEIIAMITAIGTGISEDFNIAKLRYGKIICMTDADVDGSHIRTLLLTFFYRYMKQLVEKGHIFIALPPLYRVKKGKIEQYLYSDDELKKFSEENGREGITIQRYKGLGEMNPEQLWTTTMNMQNRKVVKVTIADAVEADRIFTLLMGEEVEPRREFIQKHALEVINLDI